MTVIVVIFAEVLPKSAAIARPDGFALVVARPVELVVVALLGPLTRAVNCIVRQHPRAVRGEPRIRRLASDRARGTARRGRGAAPRGLAGQCRPQPARRPARPARARGLRRHGPPHRHAAGQRRRRADRDRPADPGKPLYPHAGLAGPLRQHRRRRARQGPAARAARGRQRPVQGQHPEDLRQALVRARDDDAAGPAQRLPAAQDAFRHRRRRIWRGRRADHARGHPGGDRRQHRRRARRRHAGRARPRRTARSSSTARCRSATSTGRSTGTCRTTRR